MNKEIEHKKLDQVLKGFSKHCHEELDRAMTCGALAPEEHSDESYMLVKIVLTICGESKQWAPFDWDKKNKKIMSNLRKFIG